MGENKFLRLLRKVQKALLPSYPYVKSVELSRTHEAVPVEATVVIKCRETSVSFCEEYSTLARIIDKLDREINCGIMWPKFEDTELSPTLHIKNGALFGSLNHSTAQAVPTGFDFMDLNNVPRHMTLYIQIELAEN